MTRRLPRLYQTRRTFLLASGTALAGFASSGLGAQAASDPIKQPGTRSADAFIRRAFDMRDLATANGDQGYGALIVNGSGEIVGQAPSRVVTGTDPTAHAEMEAIRDAARRLGSRDLSGHTMYSSSRPCPMCEAGAYWAGISKMIYGRSGQDGGSPSLCG